MSISVFNIAHAYRHRGELRKQEEVGMTCPLVLFLFKAALRSLTIRGKLRLAVLKQSCSCPHNTGVANPLLGQKISSEIIWALSWDADRQAGQSVRAKVV